MHKMIKVIAKFVDTTKNPIKGNNYKVKLYDNDIILDDLLSESNIDKNGCVNFLFDISKAGSPDSPFEKKPDLYIALYKDNSIVFESKVKKNVNFFEKDTNEKTTPILDLGVFTV